MHLRRLLLILFCFLLLLVAGFALKTYRDMGGFKPLQFQALENCRPVLGVLSSEDITVDPDNGTAFISGSDRRGKKGERSTGAIYSYSLASPQVLPEDLTSDLEFEFHPHGLDLYRDPEGRKVLFVVNHRFERDTVEIFEIHNSSLAHLESIEGDLLSNANDVVALDERRFYVTRDHGFGSDWGRWLEDYLQLGKSSVIYYDGQEFRVVAQGLAFANGINLSPDGKLLYVAATLEGKIRIYSRDPDDGGLDLQDEIFLDTGVDNIEVDAKGDLWIGAHPKLLDFVEYSRDQRVLSPSQVLRVSFAGENDHSVKQIHLSDGQYLSGSSVAALWRNYLLIGSVFDRRFLICQIQTDLLENSQATD